MDSRQKTKRKSLAPRDLRVLSASNGGSAEAWYYRNNVNDLVVVEVRDAGGKYVTTVQVRVPHPRRKV